MIRKAGLILCLCLTAVTIPAWGESMESPPQRIKSDLLHRFNIDLAQCKKSDPWLAEEVSAILAAMRSLPVELQHLYTDKNTPLKLYKNYRRRFHFSRKADVLIAPDKISLSGRPAGEIYTMALYSEDTSLSFIKRQLVYCLLHLYDRKHALSTSTAWMAISGWKYLSPAGVTLPFWINAADNQDVRAYAHPGGMENVREDFVTTALFYILPPPSTVEAAIKCRTPKKYEFMTALFPEFKSPLDRPDIECCRMEACFLDDLVFFDPNNGKIIEIGPVNMDTVKGFEILYATPGIGDVAEIAGHLLLRIKLDNNERAKRLGIENPHDLVISFLADTGEADGPLQADSAGGEMDIAVECKKNWFNLVNSNPGGDAIESVIQSLKGLSGGFLTVMDRQTLAQTLKSYTIEQDRNLLRYALNLSKEQKACLLNRLFIAKKNYKSGYYFFSKNCASVLMKVIAQGIGNDAVAHFDPLVSPPNTLIGLLLQNGIATPIYPSFYSYRKKGFIAQDILEEKYQFLTECFPHANWPDRSRLFCKNDNTRADAVAEISQIAAQQSATWPDAYFLAALIQEAEMAFSHKDLVCRRYTTPATAEARRLQRLILSESRSGMEEFQIPMAKQIEAVYSPIETYEAKSGYPHTGHDAFALGSGCYSSDTSRCAAVMTLDAALHHQDMGDLSSIAMQRSGYVDLGKVTAAVAAQGAEAGELKTWRVTALSLRKFKDRLNRVPSFFSPAGTFGLGLTLIDLSFDNDLEKIYGTLAGGEVLFNIFSSEENNRFLYLSGGACLLSSHQEENNALGVGLPLRAESLWTFDRHRKWQWRGAVEYEFSTRKDISDIFKAQTSITFRPDILQKSELLLRLAVNFRHHLPNSIEPEAHTTCMGQIQAELHFW